MSPSLYADRTEDLFTAIENAKLAQVKKLLKNKSVDLNAINKSGETLLSLAIRASNETSKLDPIVEVLIDAGVDINKSMGGSKHKWTPLQLAVFQYMVTGISRPILFKLLEQKNIDVNKRDNNGRTALHIAVFPDWMKKKVALSLGGNIDVIEPLLAHQRINVNIMDRNGNTPLDLIIERELKQVKGGGFFIKKGREASVEQQLKFDRIIKLIRSKGGHAMAESICQQAY